MSAQSLGLQRHSIFIIDANLKKSNTMASENIKEFPLAN